MLGIACCIAGIANVCAAGPGRFADYYSTQALTFRLDKKTTESKQVLTTSGRQYLLNVKDALSEPNRSVVELMLQYPEDGEHSYWWPRSGEGSYDGSTTDVVFNGKVVMKGEPQSRTFCCGLTLEVFYRLAMQWHRLAASLGRTDPDQFKSYWFCREINSPGPLDAMEAFGVGKPVPLDEALPGDFIQIWRNDRSGHSVIFVNWLYGKDGQRAGMQYWSTQTSTRGIGFASESFGSQPKQINARQVSVARPSSIN